MIIPATWKWLAIGELPKCIHIESNRNKHKCLHRSWYNRTWCPKGWNRKKVTTIQGGSRAFPIQERATWLADTSILRVCHVDERSNTNAGNRRLPNTSHTKRSEPEKCNTPVLAVCNSLERRDRRRCLCSYEAIPCHSRLTLSRCLFHLLRGVNIWWNGPISTANRLLHLDIFLVELLFSLFFKWFNLKYTVNGWSKDKDGRCGDKRANEIWQFGPDFFKCFVVSFRPCDGHHWIDHFRLFLFFCHFFL